MTEKGITNFFRCKYIYIYVRVDIIIIIQNNVKKTKDQDTFRSGAEPSPLLYSHLFLFYVLTTIQVSNSQESSAGLWLAEGDTGFL